MAFIANGSGFTLGEGTYTNIQGDLVIHQGVRRRREEIGGLSQLMQPPPQRQVQDGLKIIRNKHLNLKVEIGSGLGYLLHTGELKGRAVIVKVFNSGSRAREQMESAVSLSKQLWHPNVLCIKGISSPSSLHHFIVYENAHWKTAEGPLAAALKDDLDRSIVLGFKLIAGLSSGINYLTVRGISLLPRVENFDVFLDINDRFLFSINPSMNVSSSGHEQQDETTSALGLFSALCEKVLRSGNRVLHDDDIERTPIVYESLSRPSSILQTSPASSLGLQRNAVPGSNPEGIPTVSPRREYVWRTVQSQQSLATIAAQIARDLDVRSTPIRKFAWTDGRSIHRCPGYVREEITLATRTADSVVVFHDAPTPLEVCSVCHEVVDSGEIFRCVCGDSNPGGRPTVRCQTCKSWSHSDCASNSKEAACQFCVPTNLDLAKDSAEEQIRSQEVDVPARLVGQVVCEAQADLSSNDPAQAADVAAGISSPLALNIEQWYNEQPSSNTFRHSSSGADVVDPDVLRFRAQSHNTFGRSVAGPDWTRYPSLPSLSSSFSVFDHQTDPPELPPMSPRSVDEAPYPLSASGSSTVATGHHPNRRNLPPLGTPPGVARDGRWASCPSPPSYEIRPSTPSDPLSYPTPYPALSAHAYPITTPRYVSSLSPQSTANDQARAESALGRGHPHPSQSKLPPSTPSPIINDEPIVKRKRKRADATQLRLLNETYARTSFPSTDERLVLAQLLNMTPRSVQIWFQNKRQAMRQINQMPSTGQCFPLPVSLRFPGTGDGR